jgi:hypothetical protein
MRRSMKPPSHPPCTLGVFRLQRGWAHRPSFHDADFKESERMRIPENQTLNFLNDPAILSTPAGAHH